MTVTSLNSAAYIKRDSDQVGSIKSRVIHKTQREEHPKIVQEQNREQMEGQGKLLKTFLIASVIYTLTFGAPVKSQSCKKTGDMMIKDALAELLCIRDALCSNVARSSCVADKGLSTGGLAEKDIGAYLEELLRQTKFSQMVKEAVLECFNSGAAECEPEKYKLATAAITLQSTIKGLITEYRNTGEGSWEDSLTCKPTDEETLCWADEYTVHLLKEA